jgi:hypothetical protein
MTTPSLSSTGRSLAAFLGSLVAGALGATLLLLLGWLLAGQSGLAAVAGRVIAGEQSAWYLARSTGVVAYLLMSGSTTWGLLVSSKIARESVPPPLALAMHTMLSWLGLALAGLHALLLLFDHYYTYTLADVLLPFGGPYRPFWTGLGIVAFYLGLLTSASFSWRKWLGQARWRALHYLTFVAFILVTLHGLAAGSDGDNPVMRLVYAASGLLVLFLVNYRILAGRTRPA